LTPEDFVAMDVAAQQAVVAAVLVRNGVEDLHTVGAFDDQQAPALNRLVRQEMLQACTSAQVGGAAHVDYLIELAEDDREEVGDDFRLLCLTGAAARAVWAFVDAEGLDEETGETLAEAAQVAVCNQEEQQAMLTPIGAQFLFSYISAWEPPELSAGYRKRVGLT
jgi:hypothetical protein